MKNCARFTNWEEANRAFHAETDDCEIRRVDAERYDLPGSKNCAGCGVLETSCFACWMYTDAKTNETQISNTTYYALPCGRQLEDFIAWKRLDFATGSALKYCFRAGKKDGESVAKDNAKMAHYCAFISNRDGVAYGSVVRRVEALFVEAMEWDGKEAA